jgi:hypothetical protein
MVTGYWATTVNMKQGTSLRLGWSLATNHFASRIADSQFSLSFSTSSLSCPIPRHSVFLAGDAFVLLKLEFNTMAVPGCQFAENVEIFEDLSIRAVDNLAAGRIE